MTRLWIVLIGLAIVGVAVLVSHLGSEKRKLRKHLASMVRTPVGSRRAGQDAKVISRVVPLLAAPRTGRPCVFYEGVVEEHGARGESSTWVERIRETRRVEFALGLGLVAVSLSCTTPDKAPAGVSSAAASARIPAGPPIAASAPPPTAPRPPCTPDERPALTLGLPTGAGCARMLAVADGVYYPLDEDPETLGTFATAPFDAETSVGLSFGDAPSQPILGGDTFVERKDEMRSTLLYRPKTDGAIWVAVAAIEFGWNASAVIDEKKKWRLASASSHAQDTGSPTPILPEWEGVFSKDVGAPMLVNSGGGNLGESDMANPPELDP